jgi:hypothetical protein
MGHVIKNVYLCGEMRYIIDDYGEMYFTEVIQIQLLSYMTRMVHYSVHNSAQLGSNKYIQNPFI